MEAIETEYQENVQELREAWGICGGIKTKEFLKKLVKVFYWCAINGRSFDKMVEESLNGGLSSKTARTWVINDHNGKDPFVRKVRSRNHDRHDQIESAIKSFVRNEDGSFTATFKLPNAREQSFTFDVTEELPVDPTEGMTDLPAKRPLKEGAFFFGTDFTGGKGSSTGISLNKGVELYGIEVNLNADGTRSKDQNAYETMLANSDPELIKRGLLFNEKVEEVSAREIMKRSGLRVGQLKVGQSSFSCQAFSGANPNRSVFDPRNKLAFASLMHFRDLQPEIILLENVPGLLTYDMEPLVDIMIATLKAIGYVSKTFVLYASDYGCPQMRPRTIIVAYRKDLGIKPPTMPPTIFETPFVRDVLPYVNSFRVGTGEKMKEYDSDRPARTILKTENFQVRRDGGEDWDDPTVEELRILSTFPDSFKFVGDRDDVQRRVGNAVLPKFMFEITKHFLAEVEQAKAHSEERLAA